ncbi:MAG: hypothetical protein WAK48_10325 [Candidatus Acidiferrum sp.]|jgi:hypothetical protein
MGQWYGRGGQPDHAKIEEGSIARMTGLGAASEAAQVLEQQDSDGL